MKTEDPGDLGLARRVAEGDAQALEAMYARYADPLFAFIAGRLDGPRADAEDAWQDTWLSALRALPRYRGESRLFTWLCGIARHKVADHHRRRGQRAVAAAVEMDAVDLSHLLDRGPLPDELLRQETVRAQVVEALALLPDDYRAALVQRYADGESVDAVAASIGRSYKATESLLARARQAFRAVVERRNPADAARRDSFGAP
jgi:RNA polymerase sigma-70 factor (ECF subfamily)